MTHKPITTAASLAPHCNQCGYILQGLDPAGDCPECGLPIAQSQQGNDLEYADPRWLLMLRLGAFLLIVNVLMTFGQIVFRLILDRASNLWQNDVLMLVWGLAGIVHMLVMVAGVFLFCRVDPATPAGRRPWINYVVVAAVAIQAALGTITIIIGQLDLFAGGSGGFYVYYFGNSLPGCGLGIVTVAGLAIVQWRLFGRMRSTAFRIAAIALAALTIPHLLLQTAQDTLFFNLILQDGGTMMSAPDEWVFRVLPFIEGANLYCPCFSSLFALVFYICLSIRLHQIRRLALARHAAAAPTSPPPSQRSSIPPAS